MSESPAQSGLSAARSFGQLGADSVAEIGDLSREGSRPYERPARSLVAAVPVRPMPPSIGKRKRREEALSEAPQVLGDGCEHELVLRPAWTA